MEVVAEYGVGNECVYIYWFPFQESDGSWPCKIGKAKNLKKRMTSVSSAFQEKPRIIKINTDESFILEQKLHLHFNEFKMNGTREWFLINPHDVFKVVDGLVSPVSNLRMTLCNAIKSERLRQGMTQCEFSERYDINHGLGSRIEAGKFNTKIDTIEQWLIALGGNISITLGETAVSIHYDQPQSDMRNQHSIQ